MWLEHPLYLYKDLVLADKYHLPFPVPIPPHVRAVGLVDGVDRQANQQDKTDANFQAK
jgi:hypothetical protein